MIATVCNFIQLDISTFNTSLQIFMTLNLNPVMSIIANVPAAVASTVRDIRCPFTFVTDPFTC
jgi:hypothetical protein